ncbi:MAG: NusG domain II-containing protein [Tissierellia bacterium]|nr:NusG domain II-containing protein [Tissierellia bacterium]
MKKGDFVVIIVAVLLAFFVFLKTDIKENFQGKYLSIQVNGEEIQAIEYDDHTVMNIPIDSPYGFDEVHIEDGKIEVVKANCRDQRCVKQGPISEVGEIIICLPNRFFVEIKGKDTRIDVINY